MIKKIESYLDRVFTKNDLIPLSLILIVFSILRLPSIIEPYWYGDEGIYELIGLALSRGRILYSQIWDNKPPLLYIIYAIFHGDQFSVKLASMIVGILSVIVFYAIAKKLFKNRNSIVFSTSIFALLFGLPLLEGNIANAENFMVLPILLAFYLLFCEKSKNGFFLTGLSGILISLAFLTKIVAVFDFAAFSFSLLYLRFFETVSFDKKNLIKEFKKMVIEVEQETIFIVAFILPIIFTALYFVFNHAFSDFLTATFSQNVGYVGYGNYFLIPMGALYLKLVFLLAFLMIIFRYRKFFRMSGVVILVWLVFSLFSTFFSARPYTHYLLVTLSSFSLFVGYLLDNKKLLKFTVPTGIVILFLVLHTFTLNFKKTIPYYVNYVKYLSGVESTEKYQAFFDNNVPRDYDIAEFIKLKTYPTDNVFLWGDDAQIYTLSGKLPPGRYTVAYHITFYKNAIQETVSAINIAKPKYIIQIKDSPDIYNFLDGYELRYKIDDTKIYERQS